MEFFVPPSFSQWLGVVVLAVCVCSSVSAEDRTYDGTGNHPFDNTRGAANEPLISFGYPQIYPGNGSGNLMLSDAQRVNVRTVSNTVSAQTTSVPSARNLSSYIWLWGQFLDHDLDLTTSSNGAANGIANIAITSPNDPLGPGSIPFTRSNFVIGNQFPTGPVRMQINEVTAFIDASQVYGSSGSRASALRTNGGTGARLEMSAGGLLPFNTAGLNNDNNGPFPNESLFVAGDVRANENAALTAMHTIFSREHNRLVDIIEIQQPNLNAEQQFQLARKIVGAELQVVTYNEFLPALLGGQRAPHAADYNYSPAPPSTPEITQSFAHSAYRFGHSTVTSQLALVSNNGQLLDNISLSNAFFNPSILSGDPSNVDNLLKGAATQVSEEVDVLLVDELRNFLFGAPGAGGLDLAALNMQRGRDHGLPDYNFLRNAYNLNRLQSFNQITSDGQLAAALRNLYGNNINNLDSWIAGLAENHLPGSSVGALFNNIIVGQFERLRDGDRLFYLSDDLGLYSNGVLNPDIASIINLEDLSLADIIQWNTSLTNIQDNVFFASRFVTSGDFNGDGDFACNDIDLLVAEIATGNGNLAFDLNGDGSIDQNDLTTWLVEAGAMELNSGNPYLLGDATLDGIVDGEDFLRWNANKFTPSASWCSGDFNADGFVDGNDFITWNANKFQSAAAISLVPEPTSIAFLTSVLLLGAVSRQPRLFNKVAFTVTQ